MSKVNDLTGQTVAGQYILAKAPARSTRNTTRAWWHCRCACGKETVKDTKSLRRAARTGGTAYCTKQCVFLLDRAQHTGAMGRAVRDAKEAQPAFLSKLPTQQCWWCGKEPRPAAPNSVVKRNAAGSWTQGNTISVCRRCFMMRGGMAQGDFIAHLKAILDRHG